MNSHERFFAALAHQPVDRPPCWLGMPTPEALSRLFSHFEVDSVAGLKAVLNDDLYPVEVPYCHPPANHIACAFNFSVEQSTDYEERTLTGLGYFAGKTDPRCVVEFPWPDPAEHMTASACEKAALAVPDDKVGVGIMWSAHFQDACAAFGMEEALMTMLQSPDMFRSVIDRILEFYLQANKIFYEAAGDRLQAVLLGNDLGTQRGLLASPDLLRSLVFPGIKRLIDQAHQYNLKVIYHSCGSISEIIEDLIAAGADVVHPIQPLARSMDPKMLQDRFCGRVAFCGGVDVQRLLTEGSPGEVRAEVARLREIFPTGLILSPSHEALLPDVPPENVEALFSAATKQ